MSSHLEDWVGRKCEVALRLASGQAGGTYAESYLVLSATISAMASLLWPGRNIDQQRFLEVWARHAASQATTVRISLPLLIRDSEDSGRHADARTLRATDTRAFTGIDTLVVTGDDVDLADRDVQRLCPSMSLTEIRRFSYPTLFYEHVRSAFVHQYKTTPHASALPFDGDPNIVSYVNEVVRPGPRTTRRIHFGPAWLVSVATSIAAAVAPLPQPSPAPSRWWGQGA